MKHWMSRLLVGLAFALPLAMVTFALAHANPARQDDQPGRPDCQSCHQQYQDTWQNSAHGKALVDDVFVAAWEAQGKAPECLGCHTTGYDPATGSYHAEGVTCEACHDPVPANHPLAPASMSRSAELCGKCHRDTEFEWKNSRHGKSDLTCTSCHDPHATSLRAKDPSALCASCHGTRVAAFGHTKHSERGLTCTDCHIGVSGAQPGMGNSSHTHTFQVNLNTCTQCHEYELHNPAAAMLATGGSGGDATPVPTPDASLNSGHPATVTSEPKPVSPIGFALFAGLIGLAFGIVLAPWLERGFRRLNRGEQTHEVKL